MFDNRYNMIAFVFCRFRLDGIERSQDVLETEGVIPYAVKGNQFYKHRLLLRYLVPANEYQFPNESLSQVELVSTKNLYHLWIVFIVFHTHSVYHLTLQNLSCR
jgi:hypothetical protein